jgi:hypothetical protein
MSLSGRRLGPSVERMRECDCEEGFGLGFWLEVVMELG